MEANTNVVIGTVCCSFVTFQLLFHFISCWFSARVSLGYNSLSTEKKIEWNSRVVSTCHSMLVGIFGLYLFFFDEATIADPLWGDPSLVKINISTASGYLISDLLIILFNWKVIGDKFFIIHHCAGLIAYYFVLKIGVLAYIANFRLLAELSSPFVNQRWFFEVLKYPKFSKVNVINGILMTVVFFIVRIIAIPPMYFYVYSVYGTEPYIRLGSVVHFVWISSCIVLDVMNIMWMIKITKGCMKVISLIRQEKAKDSLQNGKLD
ncbi:TLC domain-containing protein 4 isoform X1 [Rattus norvegicus]|uniref:TLC domain containing 4 n=1 Tax=Rattus norvegicus TaxID=10116 RepID=D4AAE5_RAT|nr:TLC domain-containing protein 4 [Rattus norvegicus]XP_006233306.1 TLC domain-containing protein 4 isoform X1 [Rattus norvegicus]XP_006233308.1 TLC domain-containing protein 4 isoform X1 [Rattus norvegicus]XP_006233313.1 TLC domain-containing protein 4 isoform X1 [Rattus norvegicus]XP_006233314.1 TLC domain-containing protein 4 isoform X1 [Rattus norvegicus]XP_006233315.1 TLC domain-containing protein 4 isoform X1 [Rattus norvegicus]XP_038958729.1 TLC domain-containing protein 4 isoform X1 |eukprot:NP_001129351.1 transmembrane protein 56 [Rattus norvegicus]